MVKCWLPHLLSQSNWIRKMLMKVEHNISIRQGTETKAKRKQFFLLSPMPHSAREVFFWSCYKHEKIYAIAWGVDKRNKLWVKTLNDSIEWSIIKLSTLYSSYFWNDSKCHRSEPIIIINNSINFTWCLTQRCHKLRYTLNQN